MAGYECRYERVPSLAFIYLKLKCRNTRRTRSVPQYPSRLTDGVALDCATACEGSVLPLLSLSLLLLLV